MLIRAFCGIFHALLFLYAFYIEILGGILSVAECREKSTCNEIKLPLFVKTYAKFQIIPILILKVIIKHFYIVLSLTPCRSQIVFLVKLIQFRYDFMDTIVFIQSFIKNLRLNFIETKYQFKICIKSFYA